MTDEEKEFLNESNAIEGVTDFDSLQQAIYAWEYLKGQPRLNISTVLKTHKILMLHQPLMPNEKGYFREVPVWVAGREGLNWMKIRSAIREWSETIKTCNDWKQMHVLYERIHPFVDGNGRTGRMLMNWHRLKLGLPLLIIKASERHKYYKWFK